MFLQHISLHLQVQPMSQNPDRHSFLPPLSLLPAFSSSWNNRYLLLHNTTHFTSLLHLYRVIKIFRSLSFTIPHFISLSLFRFNQCYGVLGVLDLLHGTDDKFRASKCFSRHLMMLSLVPPREAYPDVLPKGKVIRGKQCYDQPSEDSQ